MKLIFFGTPDFAAVILKALLPAHQVLAVVTQPDRPKGRGHAVQFSPVKVLAADNNLPVHQPETLRGVSIREILAEYGADAFIAAAYGLLLPPKILALPKHGCLCVHASLLPKYRGAAPMQYAILNGDTVTGVTIMQMDKGMDTGDMVLQRRLPILPGERLPGLHDRMAALGAECILETLSQIENGTAERTPQDNRLATYAPMISKEDGHIDWGKTSAQVMNVIRATDPWPGAYTLYQGQALKVWECEPLSGGNNTGEPGTVLRSDARSGLLIKTGDGVMKVLEVQAVGGKRMAAADYLRGHPVEAGAKLA
ncbi:MAG: methionyl-tRNA formyltransferase [Clostridiales bacterium]|jgi:methionyl-tRNA formyltransferase|nr:methionyl-tRNA formyltransferase [Clostridiales bacterium]